MVEKHASEGSYFSVNAKRINHTYHVTSPGTVSLLEKNPSGITSKKNIFGGINRTVARRCITYTGKMDTSDPTFSDVFTSLFSS